MKKIKQIIFVLMLLLTANVFSTFAYTDSLKVIIDSSAATASCDDTALYRVILVNTRSVTVYGVTIKNVLDNGGVYFVTDSNVVHLDTTIITSPIFTFDSIPSHDTIRFNYGVRGYCIVSDGPHTDHVFITDYDYLLTTLIDSGNIIHPYILQSPDLEQIAAYPYSQHLDTALNFGDSFTRKYFYKNYGNAPLRNGQFHFRDSIGSSVRIDHIWVYLNGALLTDSVLTNTISDTIPIMVHNDSLVIYEQVTVVNCLDSNIKGKSFDTLRWGCYNNLCKTLTTNAFVNPTHDVANITTRVENYTSDSLCEGHFKPWTISIKNIGAVPAIHFNINIYHNSTSTYSFIDTATISFDLPTSTNHITDTLELLHFDPNAPYNNQCFVTLNDHVLSGGTYWFDTLNSGDSMVLHFQTYKCCGANDYDIIPGYGYNYDNWGLRFRWITECNDTIRTQSGCLTAYPNCSGTLYLIQLYQPEIADMGANETASFHITNIDYNATPDEYFHFYNSSAAYFKVTFQLDEGLRYLDTVYFISQNNLYRWYPYHVVRDTADTLLTHGYRDSVTAYFALSSFPTLDTLKSFLDYSRINFKLATYCPAAEPSSRYKIETFLVNDSVCSNCTILLAKDTGRIFVLCPGCHTPGFQAVGYSFLRTSLGLKDSTNDGIADTPHIVANINEVDQHKSIVGDTIVSRLTADIVQGDVINLHDLYDSLTIGQFNYCYLYTSISNAPNLRILDVKVIINSDSSSIHDTIGLAFGSLNSIVQDSANNFLYHLSLDSLHHHGLSLSYTHYSINDAFTILTTYRVDGNFYNIDGYTLSTVNNKIYLTGLPQTLSQHPDTIREASLPVNSLRTKDLYWCVGADAYFYFYDVQILNHSYFENSLVHYNNNDDFCKKIIRCYYYFWVGNGTWNVFPNEYRTPQVVDTIKIKIPHGYVIDSANSYLPYQIYSSNNYAFYHHYSIHFTIVGFDTIYALTNLYDTLTSSPINSDYVTSILPLPDESMSLLLNVFIHPICGDTPYDTAHVYQIEPKMILSKPDRDLSLAHPLPSFIDSLHDTTNILQNPNPEEYFYYLTNDQQATTRDVCWEFEISNVSADGEPMVNLWAFVYSQSGYLIFDSAFAEPSGDTLHVDANGIIHLKDYLGTGSYADFRVCCRLRCDSADAHDSIILYQGWNCLNYPDSVALDASYPCNNNPVVFTMQQAAADFQLLVNRQPTAVTNCDTMNYKFRILTTGPGTIYDYKIDVVKPLYTSLDTLSDTLFHASYWVNPHNPYGVDTLHWYLDSTSSYWHNTGMGNGDSLFFSFSLKAQCGYDGTPPYGIITGVSFCGDTLIKTLTFSTPPFSICNALNASISYTPIPCKGDNSTITASATGGTTPYTYSWSTSETTSSITGPSNTYTVTVTDDGNCNSGSASVSISQPDYLRVNGDIAPACDSINGHIFFDVSGGVSPYYYVWDPSVSTTASASGLTAGDYNVSITDSNGCVIDLGGAITISGPLHLTHGSLADTCHIPPIHTGEAFVNVTDGYPYYSYTWSPTSQTTATITNLEAGPYFVTVMDDHGCTITDAIIVSTGDPNCSQPHGDTVIYADTITSNVGISYYDYDTVIVTGTIYIAPGGSLSFNGGSSDMIVVMFAPDAKIIVERGDASNYSGLLDIKLAKLTGWGTCSWAGIDVHGYDTSDQVLPRRYQGLFIYTESVIENARSAVYVGRRDVPQPQQHEWTGGIVIGDYDAGYHQTDFINNTMSITFPAKYPLSPLTYTSASIIEYSNFISDKDLNDPCYTRPLWFIKMDSINGVKIHRDYFGVYIDTAVTGIGFNVQDTTYGIWATDSKPDSIYYNTFENVNKAIDISYTNPPSAGFKVVSNYIKYSQTGIRIKNGFGNIARNNTIKYPPLYSVDTVRGIVTDFTEKIDVRDNIVDSLKVGSGISFGITVNNCFYTYASRIWTNTVDNCYSGINTGGKDGSTIGLTVYCNTITNNKYGWSAYDITSGDFSVPEQGACTGDSTIDFPPGNYFDGNGPYNDINNFSTSSTIYYHLGLLDFGNANYEPHIAGLVNVDTCFTSGMPIHDSLCPSFHYAAKYSQNVNDSLFNTPWLGNVYPNPFNDFTTVPYYLPINTNLAEISIFDLMGNRLLNYILTTKGLQASLKVSSVSCSGGVYFCILTVDGTNVGWKKLVILK